MRFCPLYPVREHSHRFVAVAVWHRAVYNAMLNVTEWSRCCPLHQRWHHASIATVRHRNSRSTPRNVVESGLHYYEDEYSRHAQEVAVLRWNLFGMQPDVVAREFIYAGPIRVLYV